MKLGRLLERLGMNLELQLEDQEDVGG